MKLCKNCCNFYPSNVDKDNLTFGICDICGSNRQIYEQSDIALKNGLHKFLKIQYKNRIIPVFIMMDFYNENTVKVTSYEDKREMSISGINLF